MRQSRIPPCTALQAATKWAILSDMEQNTFLSDKTRIAEAGIAPEATASPADPVSATVLRYSTLPAPEKALRVADWLEEGKGRQVTVMDVTGLTPCMDALVVVTASSARHARSLADGVLERSRENNYEYLRMEGYQTGQWILVDCNDVVIHIFQAESRELYRLEALWPDALFLRQPPDPDDTERATDDTGF